VAVGYLDALAEKMTAQMAGVAREKTALPIKLEPRIWFNPDLKSAHFLIPGLMGMLLMLSAVIATSLSIVREKERETIEQINVSAVRPEELIIGKILPYMLICLITTLTVLGVGWFIFGVAIRGSPFLLAGAVLIFLFAALGMGLLISAATKSQQVAFQVATISSLLPSVVLSGLIFPISSMPLPIQGVTLIVVPRYFVSVMRSIILKNASFFDIWPNLAAMIVLGLIFNILAVRIMGRSR
jgi:ABC-2 type transport system permease protein